MALLAQTLKLKNIVGVIIRLLVYYNVELLKLVEAAALN